MLEALTFVQRGVAKREILPNSTHVRIQNGRVTAFNGTLALSAPLPVTFNAAPAARPFIKALNACDCRVSIVQDGSRLVIRSGTFKAVVQCVDVKDVPTVLPEGQRVPASGLLEAFSVLKPFVCADENRPELCGILLSGQSAFATNNPVLVEHWLGTPFPFVVNVPVEAVDEVLRADVEPESVQVSGGSITFHYADERWIRAQVNTQEWPDVFRVLSAAWEGRTLADVTDPLRSACYKLAEFCAQEAGITYFRGTDVATSRENPAALVDVPAPTVGAFRTKYLSDVLKVATGIDFGAYPQPVPFVGRNLRGVLCGVRE